MGKVIDFETGEELDDGISPEVNELIEKVFAVCSESSVEASEICFLMVTSFANSMFFGLCREHAIELFNHAVLTTIQNNDLTFVEMMEAMNRK